MRQSHRKKLVVTAVGLVTALLIAAPGVARADSISKQLREKYTEAMEQFDGFEYEEARKILNSGVLLAKRKKATDNKELAKIHLGLAIVYFSGLEEPESAKLEMLEAVTVDSSITIPEGYKTRELEEMLTAALEEIGAAGGAKPDLPAGDDDDDDDDDDDGIDCGAIEGIKHTLVDEAAAGKTKELVAHLSSGVEASKVVLYYRAKGASDFKEVKMKSSGGCKYSGSIPGDAFAEDFVHYYIAAVNGDGKAIASRGSAGLPNIIEIAGGGDDDNPLVIGDKKDDKPTGGKKSRVFLSVAVGSGGGYVSGGDTEQVKSPVQGGFAPALLHVFPEIGFYISPQTSLAVSGRIGFPVGANRDEHATAAPAGFLHLRHALSADGEGLHIGGIIGGGVIRHTIALKDVPMDEGDVDTRATGPLFVGTGAGVIKGLGGPIKLVAELNILAGLPVASMGDIEPGFAVQFDANLGLLFAF